MKDAQVKFKLKWPKFGWNWILFFGAGLVWTYNSNKIYFRYARAMHLSLVFSLIMLMISVPFLRLANQFMVSVYGDNDVFESSSYSSSVSSNCSCDSKGNSQVQRVPSSVIKGLNESGPWKALLPLVSLFITVLWSLETVFGRKWSYCADLYNKILEKRTMDSRLAIEIEASLALDLLHLEVWSNDSFRKFFVQIIEQAISNIDNESLRLQYIQEWSSGCMSKSTIQILLAQYMQVTCIQLKTYLDNSKNKLDIAS